MLSQNQLKDVCLKDLANDQTCRYLAQDELDTRKWYCQKKILKYKKGIDDKIDDFIDQCKKSKIDPTEEGAPLGDNCAGYPVLRHIEQGYDVN